jgi:hypothetical protein
MNAGDLRRRMGPRNAVVVVLAGVVCCVVANRCAGDETRRDKPPHAHTGPPPETPPVRDPERRFQLRVRNYVALKQRNIVMQQQDYSCGAACLATVAKYYWGDDADERLFLEALDEILTEEEIADRIENGLSMADLRRVAVAVGYQAVVGNLTVTQR